MLCPPSLAQVAAALRIFVADDGLAIMGVGAPERAIEAGDLGLALQFLALAGVFV
jgi:hypothetical protein